jgi:hypothetical protein
VLAIGDYAVGDHADERNRVRLQLTQLLAGQALRVRMFGSAPSISHGLPRARSTPASRSPTAHGTWLPAS